MQPYWRVYVTWDRLCALLFLFSFLSVDKNVAKSASSCCCHDVAMPSLFMMDSILVEL